MVTFYRIWNGFYQEQNQNNTLKKKKKNPSITSCEFLSRIPNQDKLLRTGGSGAANVASVLFPGGSLVTSPGLLMFWKSRQQTPSLPADKQAASRPEAGRGLAPSLTYLRIPGPWQVTWHYAWAWDGPVATLRSPQLDPCLRCDFWGGNGSSAPSSPFLSALAADNSNSVPGDDAAA